MSDRRDRGFTLVESVVVLAVMGLIAAVMAGVVAVILRNESPTNARANDSRSLHGLNSWLAQDASATAPGDFQLPGVLTECTGSFPGTSLVKMTWTEDTGTMTTYVANYRHVDVGGGDHRIRRYTCSGTGAPPFANTSQLNLTGKLSAAAPVVTPTMSGPEVIGVSIQAFSTDGEPIFVDGDSRNPAVTLPSTTTTTTTTTAPPSGPCTLDSLTATPNPVANQGSGIKRLQTDVTVSITLSGACGAAITLQYDRGDGAGLQVENALGFYPNYVVTLESDAAQPWSEANHPLEVFDGATLLNTATYDLVVT